MVELKTERGIGEPQSPGAAFTGHPVPGSRVSRARWQEQRTGYALIAPTSVLLAVFYLLPLAQTLFYSVTDWNPAAARPASFVGLDNFARIFADPTFVGALGATAVLVIGVVPVSLAGGMLLASLMRTPLRGRSVFRALIFLPFIAPTVGSTLIFSYLLSPFGGLANVPLQALGLPPMAFLATAPWALISVILFVVWTQIGYTMIIYSSAMSAIPSSYYEAASLDGAGPVRQFFSITIPVVLPVTIFLAVTGTIGALQVFTQIHILTRGGPAGSSTTTLYWIYTQGFVNFDGGAAAAGAVVLLVVGLVVAAVQLTVGSRRETVELQ